jgi:hypothetical protein
MEEKAVVHFFTLKRLSTGDIHVKFVSVYQADALIL